MHIVEQLIAERAPKLVANPRLFNFVKPLLYRMLAYDAAVFLADTVAHKTGHQAFDFVTDHINPRTAVKGLYHLPEKGRCMIISNHPTGLADGIALYQSIRDRRPDHYFLGNADALRVMPKAGDLIIPVEWVENKREHKKSRQTLIDIKNAFENERCVVIFPSGRLAGMGLRGQFEKPWENSAAMLARKYKAPVIPLHMQARNSWLYYFFSWTSPELRDITLFQELLNKKGRPFRMTFGDMIDPATLPKNAEEATSIIRKRVFSLS